VGEFSVTTRVESSGVARPEIESASPAANASNPLIAE
jgi:hypothetical protein